MLGEHWGNLALVLGPIWTGNRCDKKGPFSTAVLLTLLSELSVWIAVSGEKPSVSVCRRIICCSPMYLRFLHPHADNLRSLFGDIRFYRRYPLIALSAAVTWTAVRTLYLNRWADAYNPGNFLISLLILTVISAIFVFVSWKRRFVVLPGDLNRKSCLTGKRTEDDPSDPLYFSSLLSVRISSESSVFFIHFSCSIPSLFQPTLDKKIGTESRGQNR